MNDPQTRLDGKSVRALVGGLDAVLSRVGELSGEVSELLRDIDQGLGPDLGSEAFRRGIDPLRGRLVRLPADLDSALAGYLTALRRGATGIEGADSRAADDLGGAR